MFYNSLVVEAPLFDTSNVTDMQYMFCICHKLTTVPLYNTNKVENMSHMFRDCSNLITVPQLDTSNVTTMEHMFSNCYSLTTVPALNTTKVLNASNMFYQCVIMTQLPPIDTSTISNLYRFAAYCKILPEATINTNAATNIQALVENCYLLEKLDLTSTDAITTSYNGFNSTCSQCHSLKKLIIRNMTKVPPIYASADNYGSPFKQCYHFTGTVDATYNPDGLQDGRIYVPDAMVDALKTATH